jgi:hypothetical protein
MSGLTDRTDAPAADPAPAPKPSIRRIWNRSWPLAVIAFGLVLTIIWIFLLGYGLVGLIKIAN